jgi:hypothetical protein
MLRCIHDGGVDTSRLHQNSAAALILMKEPAQIKGVFVFYLEFLDETEAQTTQLATLTRRDLLSIAYFNQMCCARNTIPERIHFENMRRAEIGVNMKKSAVLPVAM